MRSSVESAQTKGGATYRLDRGVGSDGMMWSGIDGEQPAVDLLEA